MQKGFSTYMKGIGTGLIAGAAMVTAGSMMVKNNKSVKKNAGKAIHAVGDFIENVQSMMK